MTMPLPIVVVPVTLGQIDAVVVAGLVAAPVPVPDPPDMPGMPGMEREPPVVDVLAPCVGAATARLPAASVSDVAPRTSTAAAASEDAVPHHIRPAVPMAFQRLRTFIMTFRMTASFSL
jgi:hypothetical protein